MAAGQAVKHYLQGRKIDILVENAGVRRRQYGETEQGHEIHFGTNVLGHFALRRILMAMLWPFMRALSLLLMIIM